MILHSLPRAARTSKTSSVQCSRQLASSVRSYQTTAQRLSPAFSAVQQAPITSQSQTRSAHAISNPTLAGIEKRWEGMPPQEQAELWMQLRDRMKVDWNEMTLQEKKAGTLDSTPRWLGTLGCRLVASLALYIVNRWISGCRIHVLTIYSVVDCIWTTWPTSRRPAWRVV